MWGNLVPLQIPLPGSNLTSTLHDSIIIGCFFFRNLLGESSNHHKGVERCLPSAALAIRRSSAVMCFIVHLIGIDPPLERLGR